MAGAAPRPRNAPADYLDGDAAMNKYSKEELRVMADIALEAKRDGDHRYLMLIVTLADATGLSAAECERRITEMASVTQP